MPSNQQFIITDTALLSLLQICDSSFPTGGYTQSYGLETYVQVGLVNSKETVVQFLNAHLLESMATSDCLALALAYRAADKNDLQSILELDKILSALKIARESREASIKTGGRMLRVASELFSDPLLSSFSRTVKEKKAWGHHALVFGLVVRAAGLGIREAALALIYNTANAMVNAAVRLIPLGQNEGQWVLKNLREVMQETVNLSLGLTLDDLGVSSPALEIRAMQHECLYSRLFMS